MAVFTFYVCNSDGSSTSVEVFKLAPGSVEACADSLLVQHQGCAYVSVFQGDRPVMARYRKPLAGGACLDRPTPASRTLR